MTYVPTDERQHLLSLAQQDVVSPISMEEKICGIIPEWSKYDGSILPSGSATLLRSLKGLSAMERSEKICKNMELVKAVIAALAIRNEMHPVQYSLMAMCEAVREDTSRYAQLLQGTSNDAFTPFQDVLSRKDLDKYTADMAAFLLTGCMSRGTSKYYKAEQVMHVMANLVSAKYGVSDLGMLDALSNLLKVKDYRKVLNDTDGGVERILSFLDSNQKTPLLYKSCVCVWLISYNTEFHDMLRQRGVVSGLHKILSDTRSEKVIRVCLGLFKNLSNNDACMEEFVSLNSLMVVQLLECEKWRDNEMYDEIRDAIHLLTCKTKQLSSYDRYERELSTGELRWSFIHTEKFWYENVMKFEHDEYKPIKRLASLLGGGGPQTQAVACHDLGEFSRLHPAGKKILQKLNVKESIMVLMTHQDREVARQALLCIQKMMLQKWKDLSAINNSSSRVPIASK